MKLQTKLFGFCLSIGGVVVELQSDFALIFLPGTDSFRVKKRSLDVGADQHIVVVRIHAVDALPKVDEAIVRYCGDDGIFHYYRDGMQFYGLAKPGAGGSVSLAVWTENFQHINLYVNESLFPEEIRTADKVLQLLPMKQLLAHFGAFLLHSSRIAVDGKSILFTAPSQTGKTTQARLWERYGGARIAGNDRTLLRFADDCNRVITSGYPVDGSSPVYSSEEFPLEAIVVLRQSPENQIRRLSAVMALRFLMEQTALDAWDTQERSAAQEFWLQVLEQVPVYLLECTPDEGAVRCLKSQLEDRR